MNSNQKINLTDLIDDSISNAIARRPHVLNAEVSEAVIGGSKTIVSGLRTTGIVLKPDISTKPGN
jgi:hypothetical protein